MKKVLLILLAAILFLPLTMRAQYLDENFEDLSSGSAPDGWTILSGTVAVAYSTSYSCQGSQSLKFSGSLSNVIVLPSFSVDINQLEMTVNMRPESFTSSSCGAFQIGYVTDTADANTFVALSTTQYNTYSSCTEITVAFSSAPTDSRIAFRHQSGSTNWYWFVDEVNVHDIPSCPHPISPVVSNIDNESADFGWTAGASETNWDIYFTNIETDVPDETTIPTYTSTTTSYSFSGLSSSTNYYAYVRANCGADDVSTWVGTSFSTSQLAAELPYTQDFEDEDENDNWTIIGTNDNQWAIGTAVNTTPDGEYALYISNDDGVSNYYSNSSTSTAWAYRDIDFGNDYSEYLISFKFRGVGESSYYDYLKVYLGAPATPPASGSSSGAQPTGATLLGTFYGQSNWTDVNLLVGTQFAGVQRIYLLWWNDGSGGNNPPTAVDDFSVTGINCAKPTALTIDSTTTESITFHFSPATEDDNSWEVQLVSANDTVVETISDTTYTLTNLQHSTYYSLRVRTDCGEEYSYWTNGVTAMTDCAPQSIPYSENFNGAVSCWSGYQAADYYSLSIYDQALSMYVSQDSYTEGYLIGITPELDNEVALNTLSLSFRYKWSTYYDYYTYNLIVGTVASPDSAAATFTPIATYTYDGDHDNEWLTVEDLALTNAGADHHYIAFKLLTDNYITAYIDDIEVSVPSDCARPTNFVSTGNTATTVSLAWTAGGEETAWNVAYGPAGFIPSEETSYETAYQTSMTIEDLTTGTAYDFFVQADCSGATSEWRGPLTVIPGSFTFGITGSDTLRGCGYTIYDDGGPSGIYGNNSNYTLVIFPENEGEFVRVAGTYNLESSSWDKLAIYDGIGISGTLLWNNPASTGSGAITPVISSTGPLTLKFTSDGSGQYDGFVINQTCVSCVAPALVVQTVGSTTATITWPIVGTQDAWQVVYGPEGFNPDTATTAEDVVDNTYNISDLTGNTRYDFYIRTNCGEEYSPWSNVLSFTTMSDSPATVPYNHDWSDAAENSQWTLVNGTQTNKWYISQPTEEDNNVLFVSSNGTSETYNTSSTSVVWAYRDIQFGDGAEFFLDVKWKCYGEIFSSGTAYDYIKVYIGQPSSVTAGSPTAPDNAQELSGALGTTTSWQHLTATLNATYANTTSRLYFLWRNDNSSGTQPAGVIDSISIIASDCGTPYNIQVDNLEGTSADVNFTPAMSDDDTWEYVFGQNITTPDPTMAVTTTNTVISIDTLTPNTSYTFFVRTVCGEGEYSAWSPAFNFTTNCNIIDSLPFAENFDNCATSTIPECWRKISTYTSSSYPYITGYDAYSEPNRMYFYSSSETYNILILPKFDNQIQLNTLQVNFMYMAENSSDYMMVGVMTSPFDANTFVPVTTIYPNESDVWEEKIVSLANYEGNAHYIAFKNGTTGNYAYGYLDDIVVNLIPSCPKPMSFAATTATSSSVTLQWNEMGEADTWEVVYGEPGFNPDTATTSEITFDNPCVITDLLPATTYEFYVRAACSATESSYWSLPVTIATECLSYSMPFSEDFNATTGSDVPVCWDNSNNSYEYIYWETGDAGFQSSRCAYFSGYYGYTSLLMTPRVELTEDAIVSFMYRMGNTSAPGSTKVYVSTNGGVTKTAIETSLQAEDAWTYVWYDLSDYTGDTVNIIFEGRGTSYNSYSVYIDNVTIEALPTCFRPSALMSTGSTTTTLDITWNPGGDEDAWNIQYREVGTETWSSAIASTDTFATITNLTANTNYEIRVQANCGSGDLSEWTTLTAVTALCDDPCVFTINMSDSYGDGWNGNTISAITSAGTQTVTLASGAAGSQNITVCPNDSVFLSWNNDGSYPSECSFTVTDAAGTVLYTCTDASTLSGTFFATTCGSTPPTPACDVPTNLASNGVTHNSANITWTAGGSETAWNLQYRTQGGTWTPVNNLTAATYALTGLTAQTTYEVQVQAVCDAQATSEWTATHTFTTTAAPAPTCDVPTNLASNGVTHNSANITWTAGGSETAWNLQYRAQGGTWTPVNNLTAATYAMTGLTAQTTYEVQVQAVCTEGTSEWTATHTFTTTAAPVDPCNAPTNLQVAGVTANSAVVTWTAGGNETSWEVQYKAQSASQWQQATVQAPTHIIEGLTAETAYDVKVRAICSAENMSDFVSTTFTTTGIDNVTLSNSINLMPNPADNYVELTINSNISVKEAAIYNAFGQLIKMVQLNDNHARIDLSNMASGMYFVRIANDNTMATKKFIKK